MICAKDELQNLKELLPKLQQQKDNFDLLVVDDFSKDDTISYLSTSVNEYPNLSFKNSSKNIPGKKQALMDGLKSIEEGLILLTDADCRPASNSWTQLMVSALGKKDIVLGFSPYKKEKGFLNHWIRYEAILTAIQYLSFALNGRPYMGVGRNLLYRKSLVEEGKLLNDKMHLASGDDDLLVNSLANSSNCAIQIDPASWVYSEAKSTWFEYFMQKKRHVSTASSYKKADQVLLLLFSLSWIAFYVMLTIVFVKGYWLAGLALLLLRWISTYITVIPLFKKLDGKESISHWWYLDPLTALYFLFFSIFAIIPQKNKW